jgi:hypothetical protein
VKDRITKGFAERQRVYFSKSGFDTISSFGRVIATVTVVSKHVLDAAETPI